ncbi:MAG: adenylate/guanylate cyclase domain-containing protein [Phycisphaerales bacterium]|nr:adenylate/guanylate cyclase domain-containing protein [Phycisphaerales bacterium]
MSGLSWIRKRFLGLLVGTSLTVLTVVAYLAGWLDGLDRGYLDHNFRHWNHIDADPRIVMIDINDLALERIGRWPWPRRKHAQLINLLHECGAKEILLDLVYSEKTNPGFDDPRLQIDPELQPVVDILLDPGSGSSRDCIQISQAIHHDEELAAAIRSAGNAYVAMFFRLEPPQYDIARIRSAARAVIDENPDVDLATFASAIGPHDPARTALYYAHARLDRLLRQDFALSDEELAQKLDMDLAEVQQHISRIKEVAARFLVQQYLDEEPDATIADVYAHILPGVPSDVITPDHADLQRAYFYVLSSRFAFGAELPLRDRLSGIIPNAGHPTLPIHQIASAAKRIGFVSFEKEADGIVRHVPLLANVEGRVVPQIAFALAADVLDIDVAGLRVEDGHTLVMANRSGTTEWRVPLDENGAMMLNWHYPKKPGEGPPTWDKSFVHIPAAYVMEVADNREAILDNYASLQTWSAKTVDLMYGQAESAYLDYESKARERSEIRRRAPLMILSDADRDKLAELDAAIGPIEKQALANLQRAYQEIRPLQPESADEAALFERVRSLYDRMVSEKYPAQIEQSNADLARRNKERIDRLRERINGNICFVGHTAAAQADMVNTPVYNNMPGVMAHANLLNTLLENRIPKPASQLANVALIIVTGMIVTLLASSRGPWVTLISVLFIVAVTYALGSIVVWQKYITNLAAFIPMVSILVGWALITLYRQLTEMRHRRSLARELSRNTSPAIAAQISEQIENFELTPRPANVTCYFSDLQGFTNISERLGVEQTTAILNSYLGAMGEVLIDYRAFNKFMGDGIFAFFNAPIWPVEDHARTGCEAALATVTKLDALKKRVGSEFGPELMGLWMRIGLHCGPVFVGYFGSENQTDYTCIGDTVNLAARLESANKALGTQILVSGACREAAGAGYAFRSLGALQVIGKAEAVPVYELLGRAGEVGEDRMAYAERFGDAVEQFQNQHWQSAGERFQTCLADRPDDLATKLYLSLVERFSESPPPPDWNRAIELRTK